MAAAVVAAVAVWEAAAARIIEFRGPFIPTSAVSFIEINHWAQTAVLLIARCRFSTLFAHLLARNGQTKEM